MSALPSEMTEGPHFFERRLSGLCPDSSFCARFERFGSARFH